MYLVSEVFEARGYGTIAEWVPYTIITFGEESILLDFAPTTLRIISSKWVPIYDRLGT